MRWWYGFRKPKQTIQIIGCDVAGIVEAVGNEVTRFRVGDAVYGDLHASGFGAYAEYVCANEHHLALKLEALTFEQAGATPHSSRDASMAGLTWHRRVEGWPPGVDQWSRWRRGTDCPSVAEATGYRSDRRGQCQ